MAKQESIKQGVIQRSGFLPRVWVTLEQTIQLKDYEPVKIAGGMAMDVEDGKTVQETFAFAFASTKKAIAPEIIKVREIRNKHNK